MTQPQVAIAITANDRTAKGIASAEKRMGGLNRQGALGLQRYVGEMDKANVRAGRSLISTFSRVERASSAVLGNGAAGLGGIAKRMSSIATVGEIAASSMGEAAMSGGVLAAALGTVATGGAIVVGTLAAVGYATDKVATSWAKGVLGAANLAATIGIATDKLQAFQAAGERVGVDKNTAAGALGGLAKTLDDARYGQNAQAAGTLALLGVKPKLKADGQVDTVATAMQIAGAMQGRTPYAQRKIANNLGIGEAALPMFRQGPSALGGDMSDAAKYAATSTPGDEAAARRWMHDRARVGQMFERATNRAGASAANMGQGALDAAGATGASLIDNGGRSILKGAEAFADSVVNKFAPAAHALADAMTGRGPGGHATGSLADRIQHLGERSRQNQVSPKGARGVMQLMPDTAREAAAWAHIPYDERRMRTDPAYNRRLGEAYIDKLQHVLKTDDPALIAAGYNAGPGVVLDWLRGTNNAHKNPMHRRLPDPRAGASDADFIAGIPTNGGFRETHDYAARVAGGGEVHHHHHITIEDKRLRIKTSSPGSKYPAIFQQISD